MYKKILRPLLFKFDAEKVHTLTSVIGETLGHLPYGCPKYPHLSQDFFGINFSSPVGLAAGFDYEGRLTKILPKLGFGFQTIGTITLSSTPGNPTPRLGRLPKSQALMVNKGFRNPGAQAIIKKLSSQNFSNSVGISIGSREANITEIISTFHKFESSTMNHAYYELNISCPNLAAKTDFYSAARLTELLKEVDKLNLARPVFIKMPISKTDKEILILLDTVAKFSPKGVIIGNLFHSPGGNLSGKPTFDRSNELISLVYAKFNKKLLIIGCGGVFSGQDAFEKISRGASLVQLITGLVYQGPQLVLEINRELSTIVSTKGCKNISELIGSR